MAKNLDKKKYIGEIYGDDDLELSEDDEHERVEKSDGAQKKNTRDISFISKPDASLKNSENSLPSAGEMFQNVKKAEFIETKKTAEVDWDKFVTNKVSDTEANYDNTHAVPPPQTYDAQSQALKPTLGDTTVKKRHLDDETTDIESKIVRTEDVSEEQTDG